MKRVILTAVLLAGLNPFPAFTHDGMLDSYGNGNNTTYPGQRIRRGRGHDRDKESVQSGDIIQGMYGRGYNGSAFTTSDNVSIEMQANQNWTTTANGTKIIFKTTPDDSTTAATVMTLDDDGNLTVTGTMNTTGATTLSSVTVGSITINTHMLAPVPAAQTIGAGGTIAADACGGIKRITAAGAVTTDTTNTFAAPAASNAGCIMHLKNVGGTHTITLDTNALFQSAGAANVSLAAGDTIIVGSDGAVWYQFSALLDN